MIIITLLQTKVYEIGSHELSDDNLLYIAAVLGEAIFTVWPEIMEEYPETSFYTVTELGIAK
ncbi:MAG: hypothetical protein ACEY3D_07780 [Rickettsia sp.]|uniref:hypothetical protein n=1 Tax=Rickettsia sp. TaxID=789 RepID=UPI00397D168E